MQKYTDDFFLKKLNETGDSSVYGLAKKCRMHHNTVRDRMRNLCDRGLINQICSNPETYGPKVNEKLPPPDPGPEEKKKFFNKMLEPKNELTTIESEILSLIEKRKERKISVGKLSQLLGYHRNTVSSAARRLETKGYLVSEKEGSHIFFSRTGIEKNEEVTPLQETRAMLSVGSLLSIIKNAFTDLEAQVKILSLQNETLKNVSQKMTFENRTLVDEDAIREDERKIVFNSLSKVMGISVPMITEWYKGGKR